MRVAGVTPLELTDAEATEALGREVAGSLAPGDLILLEGTLGAGKTTLVRGLVEGLGGDPAQVNSPTFVLMQSYSVSAPGILRVHHADLYRVRGQASAPWDELGLGDALDDPGAVTAVEWPESWEWLGGEGSRVLRVQLRASGAGRRALVFWEE